MNLILMKCTMKMTVSGYHINEVIMTMNRKITEYEILQWAIYLVNHKATIRQTAEHFKSPKSTVYDKLSMDLKYIDTNLYYDVQNVLLGNKVDRAYRGGVALQKIRKEKNSYGSLHNS